MDASLQRDDTMSTFSFDDKLYKMDVGLEVESIVKRDKNSVYRYLGEYFDQLRLNAVGNTREYYHTMMSALRLALPGLEKGPLVSNDEGYPIYLFLCVFGEHNTDILENGSIADVKSHRRAGGRGSDLLLASKMGLMGADKKSVTLQLGRLIGDNMVNLMLITSCLDKVKNEKIVELVDKAKRSLIVDVSRDRHKLKDLVSDFIN